jgi:uncharacterized membrane protein
MCRKESRLSGKSAPLHGKTNDRLRSYACVTPSGVGSLCLKMPRKYFLLILSLLCLWCFLIGLYPYLVNHGHQQAARLVHLFFSHICHQRPERSLSWSGVALPVCHRCLLTYLGALVAVCTFPLIAQRLSLRGLKYFLIVSLAGVGTDVGLEYWHWQQGSFFTRGVTGGLLGIAMLWLVLKVLFPDGLAAGRKPRAPSSWEGKQELHSPRPSGERTGAGKRSNDSSE